MKFTPQTEQAITEANLLPIGEYAFTIQSAEEKVSKTSGKPMIELSIEVYDEDGKGHKIKDYLMESIAYKLRHCAYAIGLGTRYEAGDLNAQELAGLSGKCVIKIEPAKGQYQARNAVKDYVKPEGAAPKAQKMANGEAADANLPPF